MWRHREALLAFRKLADCITATSDAQTECSCPRRNSNGGTGVPIRASRHDKTPLFAIRSVDFSCFSIVAGKDLEQVCAGRLLPQMGFAVGTVEIKVRFMIVSYDVLSTTTWFSSFARRRNCSVPGSRRSRPSRIILRHNVAQEARAVAGCAASQRNLAP